MAGVFNWEQHEANKSQADIDAAQARRMGGLPDPFYKKGDYKKDTTDSSTSSLLKRLRDGRATANALKRGRGRTFIDKQQGGLHLRSKPGSEEHRMGTMSKRITFTTPEASAAAFMQSAKGLDDDAYDMEIPCGGSTMLDGLWYSSKTWTLKASFKSNGAVVVYSGVTPNDWTRLQYAYNRNPTHKPNTPSVGTMFWDVIRENHRGNLPPNPEDGYYAHRGTSDFTRYGSKYPMSYTSGGPGLLSSANNVLKEQAKKEEKIERLQKELFDSVQQQLTKIDETGKRDAATTIKNRLKELSELLSAEDYNALENEVKDAILSGEATRLGRDGTVMGTLIDEDEAKAQRLRIEGGIVVDEDTGKHRRKLTREQFEQEGEKRAMSALDTKNHADAWVQSRASEMMRAGKTDNNRKAVQMARAELLAQGAIVKDEQGNLQLSEEWQLPRGVSSRKR